jgi:hypothetical protein
MKGKILSAAPFEIESDLSCAAKCFDFSAVPGAETVFTACLDTVSARLGLKRRHQRFFVVTNDDVIGPFGVLCRDHAYETKRAKKNGDPFHK